MFHGQVLQVRGEALRFSSVQPSGATCLLVPAGLKTGYLLGSQSDGRGRDLRGIFQQLFFQYTFLCKDPAMKIMVHYQ